MKLTPEIEGLILDQIAAHPERALLLPDWCYWKGRDQPVIYVDGLPTSLVRHLYEKVVGEVPFATRLIPRDGVPRRNVNPHLFLAEPGRARGETCPNGHKYAGNEMPDNSMGWRCATCYRAWRDRHCAGGMNMGQRNARKTHCPRLHPYSGDNLIVQSDGRRRCRICNAEQTAAARARAAA